MLRKVIIVAAATVLLAAAAASTDASARGGRGGFYGGGFHNGWHGGRGLGLIAGHGLVGAAGAAYGVYDGYYAVPYYGDYGHLSSDCYENWVPTPYGWRLKTSCY